MARKNVSVEFNKFIRGIITEASPLTYPEDASLDEENMNLNRDGSRQRRYGMDWKPTTVANTTKSATPLSADGYAVNSFAWRNVGNDGDVNYIVLQRGRTIHFYDMDETPIGATLVASVTPYAFGSLTQQMSFTSAFGKLIVAYKDVPGFHVIDSSFTLSTYNLYVRDLFGIYDSDPVDEFPTVMTDSKRYNLRNQGFPTSMLCAYDHVGSAAPVYDDPVTYTNTSVGYFPSNSSLVWACKLTTVSSTTGYIQNIGTYSPWELDKAVWGSTAAPKGKYIINLFDRSTSRFSHGSGLLAIPVDKTYGGIQDITSYSGRVWFCFSATGVLGTDKSSPNLSNMICYSQASVSEKDWGKCYTSNDPTAEDINDVLATDGGFITIPEAGQILRMMPLGESLFVFATNGVWEVFGADNGGFSATTQSVLKVTELGPLSDSSIVLGDSIIAYFSENGIYIISIDKTSLRGVATNVSEDTIQSLYDDIPLTYRKNAKGVFDSIGRKAIWLYSGQDYGSRYYYNKALTLDSLSGAFNKFTVNPLERTAPAAGPYIVSAVNMRNTVVGVTDEVVTDGGVTVTDGGVDVTAFSSNTEQKTRSSIVYIVADYDGSTFERLYFSGFTDKDFVDYPRIQDINGDYGSDAPAYLLTGAITGGASSRDKWTPYITTKFLRTEYDWTYDIDGNASLLGESSCLLQAQWEWTNSANSGRWSTTQQAYRLNRLQMLSSTSTFDFDVISTRNKIRGKGQALSLLFSSEPGKDMNILGWSYELSAKDKV